MASLKSIAGPSKRLRLAQTEVSMILLMILLATNPCPAPHRSSNAASRFRKLHPCPGGKDKGSIKRCSGYVIDHKCPWRAVDLTRLRTCSGRLTKHLKQKIRLS